MCGVGFYRPPVTRAALTRAGPLGAWPEAALRSRVLPYNVTASSSCFPDLFSGEALYPVRRASADKGHPLHCSGAICAPAKADSSVVRCTAGMRHLAGAWNEGAAAGADQFPTLHDTAAQHAPQPAYRAPAELDRRQSTIQLRRCTRVNPGRAPRQLRPVANSCRSGQFYAVGGHSALCGLRQLSGCQDQLDRPWSLEAVCPRCPK
jgi:hypothetical protein